MWSFRHIGGGHRRRVELALCPARWPSPGSHWTGLLLALCMSCGATGLRVGGPLLPRRVRDLDVQMCKQVYVHVRIEAQAHRGECVSMETAVDFRFCSSGVASCTYEFVRTRTNRVVPTVLESQVRPSKCLVWVRCVPWVFDCVRGRDSIDLPGCTACSCFPRSEEPTGYLHPCASVDLVLHRCKCVRS